jgi:hypothetical protein
MTGPEHYQRAEKHLDDAARASNADDAGRQRELALIHAQLATAAAIAMAGSGTGDYGGRMRSVDRDAWRAVASTGE